MNESSAKEFGFSLENIQSIFEKYQRELNQTNNENRKLSKKNHFQQKRNEELENQILQLESRSNKLLVTLKKVQKENQKLNRFKNAILKTIKQQNNNPNSRRGSENFDEFEQALSKFGKPNKDFFENAEEIDEEIEEEEMIFENEKRFNNEKIYTAEKTRKPRYSTKRSEKNFENEQFEMKTPIREQAMSETDELLKEIEKSISKSHTKQNTRKNFMLNSHFDHTKPKNLISQTEPRQMKYIQSRFSNKYSTRKNLFNNPRKNKSVTKKNKNLNNSDLLSKAKEELSFNTYNSLLKLISQFNSGQITKSTTIEMGSVLFGHNQPDLLNQFLSLIN
ncbi:hypothetical protein M0812_02248 [Anaeramoeba flamelloides]|uniref:At4g15545-like C-terminal domain-containing protein n=1 Tax=Anaeramoeba flamelloides TaxID=1746091 RepID=A0AAV7YYX2_9EUKA|nr:hypothetical protein M0812_02248 [Anaeramoeba flamelloides]